MRLDSKIFVAGHRGMVGSSIVRKLRLLGYANIVVRDRKELDLLKANDVRSFFEVERPEYVFLAAAKVGGIKANNDARADFLYENLSIQNNVIWSAFETGVKKLLFLGSSCIYPRESKQPIPESELLQAPLEYTNEPYAIAKIAGIKLCESLNAQYGTNFISCMPTNLYGYNDNFDFDKSHVLPAILRKIVLAKWWHEEKWENVFDNLQQKEKTKAIEVMMSHGIFCNKVVLWGTGVPRREFLFSDDLASACIHLMNHVDFIDLVSSPREIRNTHVNIGFGEDISIRDLALLIAKITNFSGEILFDSLRPDGTLRKLMDSSKMFSFGWRPEVTLEEGINSIYNAYFVEKMIHRVS